MPQRPTHIRLTALQKLQLCAHHQQQFTLSLRDISVWATAEFDLPLAMVSRLLRAPVSPDDALARPTLKSHQPVCLLPLEQALVCWVTTFEQLKIPVVMWATMRAKAMKLRSAMMLAPSYVADTKFERMLFSNGWIQKLQKRHGLKLRRLHGEAASACAKVVEEGRAKLKAVTIEYNPRDIFNLDESAYF